MAMACLREWGNNKYCVPEKIEVGN